MWTDENRARYDRDSLRYPSDLTDEEWALVKPMIPLPKRGGNKRKVDVRAVVNGVMYVLSTGRQLRAIPRDLPPRSTLHHYLALRCLEWVAARSCGQPEVELSGQEVDHRLEIAR